MASGHANRANRPNTWLHRPTPANVKILLANSEPSTHGTYATFPSGRRKADISPKPDIVLVYVYALMDAFSGPTSIAPKKSVKRVLRLHKLPEA